MKILVTGGAGFIGRWVVKKLLEDNSNTIVIVDDLSSGSKENIEEFIDNPSVHFAHEDITNQKSISKLFSRFNFNICIHLAASINVQESIDFPQETFNNDVIGTFNLLEESRLHKTKFVFISTCMVYNNSTSQTGINEKSGVKPLSPYAGSKLASEILIRSYYNTYKLPVVILRPFNTYGPYQKASGEGGVVSIFIQNTLKKKDLNIYGYGTQSRDFLYVEDCADFIVKAAYSSAVNDKILNAGTGKVTTINKLASMICEDKSKIQHVEHIHPQSEIFRLCCDYSKAEHFLEWKPKTSLETGIIKTRIWIKGK